MKKYKGKVYKLYREVFKDTIYGFINKMEDEEYNNVNWDLVKCYIFQTLFQLTVHLKK